MDAIGRDPGGFALVAQVPAGTTAGQRRIALEMGLIARRGGATHIIVGIPPSAGPGAVEAAAREIADPLRAAG
jgi:hypothetical protein